jgi:hypothetical protein
LSTRIPVPTRSSSADPPHRTLKETLFDATDNLFVPEVVQRRPRELTPSTYSEITPLAHDLPDGGESGDQIHASARISSYSTVNRVSGLGRRLSNTGMELSNLATLGGQGYPSHSSPAGLGEGAREETPSRASALAISETRSNSRAHVGFSPPAYPSERVSQQFSIWSNSSSRKAPPSAQSSSPPPPPGTHTNIIPSSPTPDGLSRSPSFNLSTEHLPRQRARTLATAGLHSGLLLERKVKIGYNPSKDKKHDSTAPQAQTVRDLEKRCEMHLLEINRLKSELEISEKQRENATELSRCLMTEWAPIPPERDEPTVEIGDSSVGSIPMVEPTVNDLQRQVAHLTQALQLVTKVAFGEEFVEIVPDQGLHPASAEDRDTRGQ